jgi:hypothetical protein
VSERTAPATGRFDVMQIAAALPETAETLLVDTFLTNRAGGERAGVPRLSRHAAALP